MNTLDELNELLERYEGTYINENNVLFNQVSPGFYFVNGPWPGFNGEGDISLAFLCNEEAEFLNKLMINSSGSISEVTSERLHRLFLEGDAVVLCSVDRESSLEFEVHDGLIFVKQDNATVLHEVEQQLVSPVDFIDYTRQYFLYFNKEKSADNPN